MIQVVAETGSTNADLAASSGGEGDWLRAERQLAGRGRQGRAWASPVGNLYASTIVRPRVSDPAAPTLTLVAAVALHDAVSVMFDPASPFLRAGEQPEERQGGLAIKWPNDLLLNGAKLSGILLERAGDVVIAGFGVNVAHHPDLPDRPTTSLAAHGVAVAPATLLDILAESFARWLATWRGHGLEPVRAAWLDRAHPVGTALCVHQPDGSRVDGLFDGLDDAGALLLRLAGGERQVIHAADVFLL
ncbi:biotin--[acetyl-CoA-carboxylase] ligase [Sphingomonas rubra]|uniref:biotin--[acetyl-CoA-carboxylase] ligase n=1 Tax=Sphingomonas rubra TaxID=634430 RepID=UPI000B80D904